MSTSKRSKASFKTIAIELALTGIVWFLFLIWFRPHVPSYDPTTILFVSGFTALPATGTFYLCMQMLKVTLAHQREIKNKQ